MGETRKVEELLADDRHGTCGFKGARRNVSGVGG